MIFIMFVNIRTLNTAKRTGRAEYLPCGHNLQPVSIRVFDEINAHRSVFEANAAHFAVQRMRRVKIIRAEGKVEFTFTEVIFLRMIAQPRQFKLEAERIVCHVDNDEGTVRGVFAAHLMQTECLLIEGDGGFQVADVVVFVDHAEIHRSSSFPNFKYGDDLSIP